MSNLPFHQILRRTVNSHQTHPSVSESVHSAAFNSKGITQRIQHSPYNITVMKRCSLSRRKHKARCPFGEMSFQNVSRLAVNEDFPESRFRLRWDFPAIPNRSDYFNDPSLKVDILNMQSEQLPRSAAC